MAKLARSVFVRDAAKHRDVLLKEGEEPALEYAVLVKNPACWEGGKLPAAVKRALADKAKTSDEGGQQDSGQGNDPDAASGDDSATSTAADDQSSETEPAKGDAPEETKPAARKTAARKTAAPKAAS